MKQKLLKTMLLLCALVVGSGSAWADTSTLTFTAACGGSGTADDGAKWTVTSNGTESNFSSDDGIHYGTNSASVTYIQLATSDISGTISQVVVRTRDARATATVSVTVGGTAFTCSGSTTATNTSADYTFTGSSSGEIVVRVDRGSSNTKALYVKTVAVTYSGSSTYSVTYDANGATSGSVPTDNTAYSSGATVTVLGNTGSLVKTGYSFGGWNTQADGDGTNYTAGTGTFSISANTTLYAKWNAKVVSSLAKTGTLSKTTYTAGESFDPTGLTITATYTDESEEDVTASVVWAPDPLTVGTTSVTGTYMGETVVVNGLTVTQATEFDINLNNTAFGCSTGNNAAEQSLTSNGVTVVAGCESSAQNKTYYDAGHVRFYNESYLRLTAPTGYDIAEVVFTDDGTWNGSITVDNGTYDNSSKTWTGTANAVEFSFALQNRASKIAITLAKQKTISSIALSGTYPTTFNVGDAFSHEGMTVTANFDDETNADVTTQATFTGYNMSTAGVQTVTVSYNTKTTTYSITVNNVAVTGVSVNKASTTIEKGKTETLTPTFTPSNATNKTVTWESDDTDVATVSAAGVVTAVAAGTANITVTTEDGDFTATCVVTVVNEKGTIDAPFSVAEVMKGDASGKTDVYVIGYIVGNYNSTAPVKPGGSLADTNFALADEAGETTGSKTIPVELTSGSGFRSSWGPASNTNNIDVAKVIIKGNGEKYFSTNAIKGASSITKVAEAVQITDASGFATWASDSPLDFTDKDIDAYIAVTKGNGTGVTFTQVNKVPANTGLLIHYSGAKTEEIPVFDGTGAETVSSNKFVKGTGAAVTSDDGTNYNYILNRVDDVTGFYRANGKTVAKNRAYISILKSETPSGVKEFIALPGSEETAVEAVKADAENGVIFNLAGQRIQKLQRGINIVNGRKVVVK